MLLLTGLSGNLVGYTAGVNSLVTPLEFWWHEATLELLYRFPFKGGQSVAGYLPPNHDGCYSFVAVWIEAMRSYIKPFKLCWEFNLGPPHQRKRLCVSVTGLHTVSYLLAPSTPRHAQGCCWRNKKHSTSFLGQWSILFSLKIIKNLMVHARLQPGTPKNAIKRQVKTLSGPSVLFYATLRFFSF